MTNIYQQIFSAVTNELAVHRQEIERNEHDIDINLTWLDLRVYLDHGDQTPIKVTFQSESVRQLRKKNGNGNGA